jgi:glycosyltransferase involved in cell wall biosynthesis
MHGCADVNLCTSAPIKAELEAHGIPRLDVWQRAVDSQRFHPTRANAAMRARLSNGAPDQPLLLYAGRLAPEKDLETLAALMARLPDVRLALVGDGPQRSALERMLPGSRTTFTGYLHGDELATAFASSDVFVLPSRTETLGLVALEAMASGCAVVAARAGGIPDLVTDDLTGYLYEPGDPDALMAAVRRALGASESRTDDPLRVRARREAERWTWSAATRQLETFYRAAQQSQVHLAPVRRLAAAQNTVVATSILIQILAGLFAASLRLRARAA